MNPPNESKRQGRSPKVAMVFGAFVLLVLIASAVIVLKASHKIHPPQVIPRDVLDDSQSLHQAAASADVVTGQLTVSLDQAGPAISPTLFGLALEEINHSLDGGLYAELLSNRDLSEVGRRFVRGKRVITDGKVRAVFDGEVVTTPASWSLVKSETVQADMTVDVAEPSTDSVPRATLRLTISTISQGQRAGVANEGYWGVPVKPGCVYHAVFYAKASDDFSGPVSITIESNDNATTYTRAAVTKITSTWQRYDVDMRVAMNAAPSLANRFVISASSKGTLWIAQASLFPPTFNNRRNGNRIDLMEKLADLKPAFIVFPGGDTLLGPGINSRFDWKKTIGPVEKRSGQYSTWHHTSNGFGLMEFLLTCEELKAQPVLGIYSGTSIRGSIAPGLTLQSYVQDALDEIEYVTGDESTPWGTRRAEDGHPEPFNLQCVQIGNNEQLYNKDTYDARFTQFHDAIKAKYPTLKLIGWMNLATTRAPDVLHESFYPTAHDLMEDGNHYDSYSREGPRYATEFNAKEGDPTKTLNAALADMSWMLGVQRNADVVLMATAAPLFVNVNGGAAQHPANLIGYDGLTSFGSPSYYALRMFNQNKGDTVIPVTFTPPQVENFGQYNSRGAVGVGTWGSDVQYKDIKVTAPDGSVLFQSDFSESTVGWQMGAGNWKVEDGTLHQTSNLIDCTALAGDPNWTDYTLTLKARKNSGLEGFLILVHAADSGNFLWWNLGGWDNRRTGVEQTLDGGKLFLGDLVPNHIETGKWYDIRVEVKAGEIVCYLDNIPIMTAAERPRVAPGTTMFAAASRDGKTGEVILKVVNVLPVASLLDINLEGGSALPNKGTLEVMSGGPGDVNTINAPDKIDPRRTTVHFPGSHFSHEFPPYSISVLRMNGK